MKVKEVYKKITSSVYFLAVLLGLIGVILVYFFIGASSSSKDAPVIPDELLNVEIATGSRPMVLRIPSLGIESNIQHVGITESGKMATPEGDGIYSDVGWYRYGAKPGEIGNAVIAGHFDNGYARPAVFYEIETLEVGAQISVEYDSGKILVFEVKEKQIYDIETAPLEKIFGPSDKRMLNLITCNGEWNPFTGEYDHRTIIFTELIDEQNIE